MNPSRFLFAAALALSGCHVESVHPLADDSDVRADKSIIGSWIAQNKSTGNTYRLEIREAPGNRARGTLRVEPPMGGIQSIEMEIAPTIIGAQTYASILIVAAGGDRGDTSGYIHVHYQLEPDGKLTIRNLDFRTAVTEGRAAAGSGRVTFETARLRELIASQSGELAGDVRLTFTKTASR